MKMKIELFTILFIPLFFSCNRGGLNDYKRIDSNSKVVREEGKIHNGLEEGRWSYYDINGKLQESGSYSGGYKIGTWEFSYDSVPISIKWEKTRSNKDSSLLLSLPSSLKVENTSAYDFYASNPNEVFEDLILVIHKKNEGVTIDSLNALTHESIKTSVEVIDYSVQKAKSGDNIFYSNYYVVKRPASDDVYLLYIYIANKGNVILDVAYKTKYHLPLTQKMLFSNILFHSFYDGVRFLDPYESVIPL